MFVGTWNVGGKAPHEDLNLRDWLLLGSQAADLYVIGYVFLSMYVFCSHFGPRKVFLAQWHLRE